MSNFNEGVNADNQEDSEYYEELQPVVAHDAEAPRQLQLHEEEEEERPNRNLRKGRAGPTEWFNFFKVRGFQLEL